MKRELNFWVLGGDLRQACLARLLAEDGHRVHTYALSGSVVTPTENLTLADSLDGIGRADCVVLPLPVAGAEGMVNTPLTRSALPLASLLDALSPPQILCGGRVDPVSAAMADARGLILRDYFAREELAVANAVPTAEGAVQLAMEQMPVTIHGARVLITGFGRVGQAAARRFAALGARVSVAARRYEQLALAESEGYGAEQIGSGSDNEIWSFGDEAYEISKKYIFLRERLRDYIRVQMKKAHEDGTPVMRPVFYDFPTDPESWNVEDAYLFGPDLYVAPVMEDHVTEREVYLPDGTAWFNAWTGEKYEGGQKVTVAAPMDTIPVFVKEGADTEHLLNIFSE